MTKTVDYTRELFDDVMDNMVDYHQIGETVCGAEDPAVVSISEAFIDKYPEFKGFTTVRVIDQFVNPWKSDTVLEFSDRDITDAEYAQYEELSE